MDFHQKFPVEKYFCRGQKYFSGSEISENFPKGNQWKFKKIENLNFRFSLISLWKKIQIFRSRKIILASEKYISCKNYSMNFNIKKISWKSASARFWCMSRHKRRTIEAKVFRVGARLLKVRKMCTRMSVEHTQPQNRNHVQYETNSKLP